MTAAIKVVFDEVKHAMVMRILGSLLILLSAIEFGIGGAVYGSLANVHLGAWWAAICTCIAGVMGLISNGRSVVILGSVFSIFGIIVAIVGAIVDGISSAVFAGEKACRGTKHGTIYGDSSESYNLDMCAYDLYTSDAGAQSSAAESTDNLSGYYFNSYYYNHHFHNYFYYNYNYYFNYYNGHHYLPYYNFYYYYFNNHNYFYNYYYNHPYQDPYYHSNHNNYHNSYFEKQYYYNHHNTFYYSYGKTFDCVCADTSQCYGYMLGTLEDCGEILTTYTSLLCSSTAMICMITLVCLVYSIFTCLSCASGGASAVAVEGGTTHTTGVQLQPVQIQVQPSHQHHSHSHPHNQPVVHSSPPAPSSPQMVPMQLQGTPIFYAPQYASPGQPMQYAHMGHPIQYAPIGYAPVGAGYVPQYTPQSQYVAQYAPSPQQQQQQQFVPQYAPMGGGIVVNDSADNSRISM